MPEKSEKWERINAPVEGTWENKPFLKIPLASGKPFGFGVEKAHAILRWYEQVKAFCARHPSKAERLTKEDLKAAITGMSAEDKSALAALLAS